MFTFVKIFSYEDVYLFLIATIRKITRNGNSITGSMSGKVKGYVGRLSITQNPLSMKPSGNLVMSHSKTEHKMLSNSTYVSFISQEQPLTILVR